MKDIINEQITRMKNIRKKNSRVAMIITMFALMVAMGVSWKMKIIGRGCGHFLGPMLPTLNSYDTA
ncbi:MAG: hypothetical protein IIT48_09760 [Lachnospiraceae bacterium]|nr:hypothetical protein [Lachnospiraceae bacterium]